MSARREARARVPVMQRPTSPSHVPPAFRIGRCIEVWAARDSDAEQFSAMRRFGVARDGWAQLVGADKTEIQALVPKGTPWSAEYLSTADPRSLRERFERAGCTVDDLADLQDDAEALHAAALGGSRKRAYQLGMIR